METTPEPIPVVLPATGETERHITPTPIGDLPGLLEAARAAQASWARASLTDRSVALRGVVTTLRDEADRVADAVHRFNGKSVGEALISEVFPTLAGYDFFARCAAQHLADEHVPLAAVPGAYSRVIREPLGVIGVIAPWNYPFHLSQMDVPAALMAGNAVIIKMSEHAAGIGEVIVEILEAADLPRGLVQVIQGRGDLGEALIGAGIDKVCFTGSTTTGRAVYAAAARAMIPCTLEMGGKDAALVLEDADLEDAADGIVWAAMTNAGQVCASIETVHVPRSTLDPFLAAVQDRMDALAPGEVGPMTTGFQRDKVLEQVDEALAQGAAIAAEGPAPAAPDRSVTPQFLVDVPDHAALAGEETFGPVCVVRPYDDLEAAVAAVNDSPYGLTASVWTADREHGVALARLLEVGTVTINEHVITPGLAEAPWAGQKESGLGGISHSHLSLASFTKVKYVYHDRGLVRFRFWRFPMSAEKVAWFRGYLRGEFANSTASRLWHRLRNLPRLLLGGQPRVDLK